MANEDVARNGLISQNNIIVTGSARITAGITGSAGMQLTAGNLLVGVAADTGLYKVDVNGAVQVQNAFKVTAGGASITGPSSITGSFTSTAGFTGSLLGTSSLSTTSSFAVTASTLGGLLPSIFATTGSNTFIGTQIITGSLAISGSITGSHLGTSSYAVQALTSSFAITSSYLLGSIASASYVTSSGVDGPYGRNSVVTSSFAVTASYIASASLALTASYVNLVAGPNIVINYKTTGIEISGSGAGSGVPGGSNTQIQYNNAGAFGGVSVLTFDGTNLKATGSFTGSFRGDGSLLTGVVASATPGGPTNSVQFNNAGTTSGSANFLFNRTTNVVTVTGSLLLQSQQYGTALLSLSSSNSSSILSVVDNTGSADILTITTGSSTVFNLDALGSTTASLVTNALYLGSLSVAVSGNQNDFSPAGWDGTNPSKKTLLSISGSTSVKITGLAGGIDGRMVVLQNDSPDFLIILEDQSTSSQAANRFDFRNPIFLLPNGTVTMLYDGHSQRWEPIASSGGIGYGAFFNEYEDFLGDIGTWGVVATGTNASGQIGTYLQNTTEKPIGIWQIDTGGTASTARAHLGSTQNNSIYPGYGQAIFLARVALEQLSTASQRFNVSVGWHNAPATSSATNGVYWRYADANSANWQAVAQSASLTVSSSIEGPVADTNYIWLGTHANSDWSKATYFYSTDSTTWTITGVLSGSRMMTTANTSSFGVSLNKTIGTTQANVAIDLLAHRYDITRG